MSTLTPSPLPSTPPQRPFAQQSHIIHRVLCHFYYSYTQNNNYVKDHIKNEKKCNENEGKSSIIGNWVTQKEVKCYTFVCVWIRIGWKSFSAIAMVWVVVSWCDIREYLMFCVYSCDGDIPWSSWWRNGLNNPQFFRWWLQCDMMTM